MRTKDQDQGDGIPRRNWHSPALKGGGGYRTLVTNLILPDLVNGVLFSCDFGGPGMVPLDPGRNSMHFAAIDASVALIWTRLKSKVMF